MTTRTATHQLVGDLAARFASEQDVLVAYVFGSQTRGSARPDSDVDVAVLLEDGADTARRALELGVALGGSVDLVVLNGAPVALAYRVLRDGVVVVCRDERARVAHWVSTVDRYLDSAPLRRVLDDGLRRRLREGRFGRR